MSRRAIVASSFALVLLAAGAAGTATASADQAAAPTAETLAKGLVSPLSLAVSGNGTVYVAQSFAGMLTKVEPGGRPEVLYTATKRGTSVGAVSQRRGSLRFATVKGTKSLLWAVGKSGRPVKLANLGRFERKANPDQGVTYGFQGLDPACAAQLPEDVPNSYTGIVESNPYASEMTRRATYVADAAGNDILSVSRKGRVRALAVLPPVPLVVTAEIAAAAGAPACVVGKTFLFESVPTDVERKGGSLYVSTLTGGPEDGSTGAQSRVYRIGIASGSVTLVAQGLVSAVGLDVSKRGDIFVSQLFTGQIAKIAKGSSVATPWFSSKLTGDVEWTRRGVYATTNALPPEQGKPNGKVVRIR
jgi:hypothetical protein